jgi:hypothetical protein
MDKKHESDSNEINDLKQELKNFQEEKERVREILGAIGGVPKFRTKLINVLFIATIAASLVITVLSDEKWQLLMIEIAMVALSMKIIYLIHCQMRVNHFVFWILSSIEWRINELAKLTKEPKRQSQSQTNEEDELKVRIKT